VLALFALILVVGYAFASSWAVRRGRSTLVACAAAAFLLLVVTAVLLGSRYHVPSTLRLVTYVLGFAAPVIVVPTAMLWARTAEDAQPPATSLPIALVGAGVGFVLGYLTVVFGFGTW
jgi:hypothetical protein